MSSLRLVLPLVLALSAPVLAQDLDRAPVATSFDPRLDGMPFENLGDYASDGNCFGMSLLAVDNYVRRMRARAEGRPDPAPLPITRRAQDGHVDAQILASLVQAIAGAKDDGENNPLEPSAPGDGRAMREALARMRRTGVPELMGMYAKDGAAHAIVLFGYDGRSLQIYDPNYPGETIRWPWDPARGLGRHPKRSDDPFYGPLESYDVGPFDGFRTSRELQALRDACARGLDRCVGRFHSLDARLTGTTDRPVVSGTVGPGMRVAEDGTRPQRPRRVYVLAGGTPTASARLRPDGSFEVALPRGARTDGLQVVVVTEDGTLAGRGDVQPRGRVRSRGLAAALGD